jgi:hypothetical protein
MCVFAKCLDPVPRQKQLATDRANTFARQKQRLATRRISHSSETGSCDTGSTSLLRNSVWRHVGSTTSLTRHSWRHTGPTTSLVKQRLPTHRINDFAHHTVDDRQDQLNDCAHQTQLTTDRINNCVRPKQRLATRRINHTQGLANDQQLRPQTQLTTHRIHNFPSEAGFGDTQLVRNSPWRHCVSGTASADTQDQPLCSSATAFCKTENQQVRSLTHGLANTQSEPASADTQDQPLGSSDTVSDIRINNVVGQKQLATHRITPFDCGLCD